MREQCGLNFCLISLTSVHLWTLKLNKKREKCRMRDYFKKLDFLPVVSIQQSDGTRSFTANWCREQHAELLPTLTDWADICVRCTSEAASVWNCDLLTCFHGGSAAPKPPQLIPCICNLMLHVFNFRLTTSPDKTCLLTILLICVILWLPVLLLARAPGRLETWLVAK